MTPETKTLVLEGLGRLQGDDLYRARAAFKNRTPEQMQEQWGQSGQTCAEVLAGYEANHAKVQRAIDEVAAL